MLITQATTPLGQAVAGILTGICALVAHHAARSPISALLVRAHARLVRLATGIDSLAHHWQPATLPKPRAGHPRAPHPAAPNSLC